MSNDPTQHTPTFRYLVRWTEYHEAEVEATDPADAQHVALNYSDENPNSTLGKVSVVDVVNVPKEVTP